MDEATLWVIVAPFYTIGLIAVGYCLIFMIHSASTMGQSATQTKLTETIPAAAANAR